MAPNQLQFIKQLLYTLNRNYGAQIDFYRNGLQTVDNVTGSIAVARTKYRIRRAIRLPDRRSRVSQIDLSFIRLKSTPTGDYDVTDRELILETKQLPKGFVPTIGDYVVFDHVRYVVKTVVALDLRLGYFLTIGSTDGEMTNEIFELKPSDQILFSDVMVQT